MDRVFPWQVPKENTIVFLLTDGNANSMWSTRKAATDLKETATLYVVIIGNNVNMRQAKKWPSYPWEVCMHILLLRKPVGCRLLVSYF